MMVPRSRLLSWVGMVVVPFAVLAAAVPGMTIVAWLAVASLAALVLMDAARAYGRLDDLRVALPQVVRLTKDREGTIELLVTRSRVRRGALRFGLAFPREFETPHEDMVVRLPQDGGAGRLEWPCTPLTRGNYVLEGVYVEEASPLGFWAVRAKCPTRAEIRVYPNLFSERKHLAALFLNRGSFGVHAQRQMGKGREFEKLRDYIPGDSYDEIHWKATAKRGRPVTKVFQIERTQEVYVLLDTSRLSARVTPGANGGPETTQLERFMNAALILGLAAERQGDLFGVVTFADRMQRFVRARNGKAHYGACRDALYTLQPRTVTPDFEELCVFVRTQLRRRALLVILTNLDDPVLAEAFVRAMDIVRRQHLVLVNMLTPPGARPLFSDGSIASLDEAYAHLGGHIRWQGLRELQRVLHRRGITFSLLDHENLSAQVVSQYVAIKQRQLV